MAKKRKTRYKWTKGLFFANYWTSLVGDVIKRPWGKFNGFPYCLGDKAPYAEDDRSYDHMVHRPKRHSLEQRSETIDFETLVACQLAVEKAHRDWKRKQAATQNV